MTDLEARLRAVPRLIHDDGDYVLPDYPALAVVVQEIVEEKEGQRQAWKDTAAQAYRNTDYYRSLVREIGMMIGSAAYVADDGTVNDDVCAKVPELIRTALVEQARELADLTMILTDATADVNLSHGQITRLEGEVERLRGALVDVAHRLRLVFKDSGQFLEAIQSLIIANDADGAALRATPEARG